MTGASLDEALVEIAKLLGTRVQQDGTIRWLGWTIELIDADNSQCVPGTAYETVFLHATPWDIEDPNASLALAFTELRVPHLILRLLFGLLYAGEKFIEEEPPA